MTEFNLISRHFSNVGADNEYIALGVGDDAALLNSIPVGYQLVFSIDTMLAGVHFPDSTPPHAIGYKALAVNLSDMAAMGATPVCCLLALTLPEADDAWCAEFAKGMHELASRFGVKLVGGDTTRGPLCVSIQITGLVPEGSALTRSGAQVGDTLYVSGPIGNAGAGLKCVQDAVNIGKRYSNNFVQALNYPEPQVQLGELLRNVASSAIDISDGLYQDLGHICEQSHCGAMIELPNLPIDPELVEFLEGASVGEFALQSGDDYQLLFTIPQARQYEFDSVCESHNLKCTAIGKITDGDGVQLFDVNNQSVTLELSGYQHFVIGGDDV